MLFKVLLVCFVSLGAAEDEPQPNREVLNRLAMATQRLSVDILYDYVKDNPGESYITSTPPLFAALSVTGSVTAGTDRKEILKILNLNNQMEITRDFAPAFKEYISNNTKYKYIEYFGKVYADEDTQFTSKFKKVVKSFNEKTGRVNFNDTETAANEINAEIEKQGKLGFEHLVTAEDVENGGLLFVSTLEFITKFNQKSVSKPSRFNFTTGNDTMEIPAFTVIDNIPYAKIPEIQAQVYEFKLYGGQFSILIFYPDAPDGLEAMLEKMRKPKLFNEIIEQLDETCVQATLPMVNSRSKVNLGESLQKVRNASDIFDSSNPQLEGIQKNSTSYIGSILHETSLNTAATPAIKVKNVNCGNETKKVAFEHPSAFFLTSSNGPRPALISGAYVGTNN